MKPPVTRKALLKVTVDPEKTVATVDTQEGTIAFQIEGQPVQHLKAGDAFYEPANVLVARFDNDGDTPAKFVVHYLLSKDKDETVRILDK